MCGICGLLFFERVSEPTRVIASMARLIRHRGPDDEGYLAVSTGSGAVTPLSGEDSQVQLPPVVGFNGPADLYLAHRRLSIVDLSPAGHQPMSYDNGNLWITYNGELYNHEELRSELESLGHVFQSRTDTEVLLAAYREWGEGCLDRLDGMWAFVIYDRSRGVLFGSRDRFGVKPFYFVKNSRFFAFASEAKAFRSLPGFKRTPREDAIFDYLVFGMERWEDGNTFIDGVMELPVSGAFRLDLRSNSFTVFRYYSLPCNDSWEPFDGKKAKGHVERVREVLHRSVRRHLSSDVPVGSCLSGGIDSSAIVGFMASILKNGALSQVGPSPRAFTACYDDPRIDESPWAKMVAEETGSKWHVVYPKGNELIDDLEDLVRVQDFPFGSTSIYAQYRVMKLAKESGVTVLLDGQGGDELFTGYTPYYAPFFTEMVANFAWKDLYREWRSLGNSPVGGLGVLKGIVKNTVKASAPSWIKKKGVKAKNPIVEYLSPSFVSKNYGSSLDRFVSAIPDNGTLNHMLGSMMTSRSLQTLLRYEDRNSMRFQIESRTPFADDRRLIEAVFAIPSVYKIHNGFSKWLLRESSKSVLPSKVYRRTDKIGFATPEYDWLLPQKDYFKEIVMSNSSSVLDTVKLGREWDNVMTKQPKTGITPLWRLINLALWLSSGR